jgi:hypothetical protein
MSSQMDIDSSMSNGTAENYILPWWVFLLLFRVETKLTRLTKKGLKNTDQFI